VRKRRCQASEKTNLNHWTVILATPIQTPETRIRRRELTGKYAVKIMIKHTQMWNYDRNGGENLCYKTPFTCGIAQSTDYFPLCSDDCYPWNNNQVRETLGM
jgi:hypothetical protein